MSGVFRVGQLVQLDSWLVERCDLLDTPVTVAANPLPRVVGSLEEGEVALVVALARADGSSIYVFGPRGGGWAPGSFFVVVKDVVP